MGAVHSKSLNTKPTISEMLDILNKNIDQSEWAELSPDKRDYLTENAEQIQPLLADGYLTLDDPTMAQYNINGLNAFLKSNNITTEVWHSYSPQQQYILSKRLIQILIRNNSLSLEEVVNSDTNNDIIGGEDNFISTLIKNKLINDGFLSADEDSQLKDDDTS